jgi:long-subunit fatty acid transport protein
LAAEFFADLIDEAPELFGNRSRLSVGLGYVINQNWTVDLRYHWQRSRSTIDEDFKTSGNVIDFTVKSSFRIRDLVKGR